MKRLGAAIALLSLAAGIAWWSGYVFRSCMDYFENQLLQILVSPDEQMEEKTQNVSDEWMKRSAFLRSVFVHKGIDELEILITSLPMTLRYSGSDGMKEKCIEGINLIRNLKSCEKLSLENVL